MVAAPKFLLVDTAVAPDADAVDWINPRLQPGEALPDPEAGRCSRVPSGGGGFPIGCRPEVRHTGRPCPTRCGTESATGRPGSA